MEGREFYCSYPFDFQNNPSFDPSNLAEFSHESAVSKKAETRFRCIYVILSTVFITVLIDINSDPEGTVVHTNTVRE